MIPDLEAITEAIKARMEAGLPHPAQIGQRTVGPPCYVIHQIDGAAGFFRDLDDSHADGMWAWQITCVSQRREQAMWLRRDAVDLLLADPPDGVQRVAVATLGGVDLDRDVTPFLWTATPVLHLTIA